VDNANCKNLYEKISGHLTHLILWDVLCKKAAEVYQRYGYNVIPIRYMNEAGDKRGSLRCMAKVTGRKFI
jgi:hypothetical protein